MGEPESGEGQSRDPEAGALPEGARLDQGSGPGAAQRDELSSFRGRAKSAGDLSLDLACAMDEPEQLVRSLMLAAHEQIGFSLNEAKWKVILGHVSKASEELEKLNEPASHRGAKTASS